MPFASNQHGVRPFHPIACKVRITVRPTVRVVMLDITVGADLELLMNTAYGVLNCPDMGINTGVTITKIVVAQPPSWAQDYFDLLGFLTIPKACV